jgi:protein ImuB
MLWAALLLPKSTAQSLSHIDASGLATWGLQFTPHVTLIEESVLMEVEDSARLFGGKRSLAERIRNESTELGVEQRTWAPTSLGVLALARAGISNGFAKPLATLLDALPLDTLTAVALHAATLERLGCRTLGQVAALPRGGLARRFDKQLLVALDQAYGRRPEAHEWVLPPDNFAARLELMSRVDTAPALLFGARRLLLQMCGWLAARRAGTTAFTLRWCHDIMRARTVGEGGELTIRTAEATRNIEHLTRLLTEHLNKVQLVAPVGDLELVATVVQSLVERSASLLPDPVNKGEVLELALERISARLGADKVLRPAIQEDHRMDWMTHWHPAAEPRPKGLSKIVTTPQPSVVHQLEVFLFNAARARVTLARMSDALAVQMNGLGSSLCAAMYSWMASSNSGTLVNTPLRIRLSVMSRKNRSTILSHDALVGVKCM